MTSTGIAAAELYIKLTNFITDHARFSDRVFGTVEQRGPKGPLKHMRKEAQEAIYSWIAIGAMENAVAHYKRENISYDPIEAAKQIKELTEAYHKELADLFLLLVDAMRRSNMKFGTLLDHAIAKLRENEQRAWPAFDPTKVDEAIEHVRE